MDLVQVRQMQVVVHHVLVYVQLPVVMDVFQHAQVVQVVRLHVVRHVQQQ